LRAQKKRLVLLSSNSQSLIETVLKKEACDLFDEVIGDAGLGAKHRALHHVIRKVDISKEKIIYIGDEIRDIKAARACGIKSGVVSFGYTDLDILCLHEPDEIFTSIEELMLV
jgi:phosphoglycolate phosphatase